MRTAKYKLIAMFSVLATALGLFPTLAAADISDVLTINGTAYTLNEPTSGGEASLTTPVIPSIGGLLSPVSASLLALQEVDPVTGTPLVDSAGNPVISDYLQTSLVQVGTDLIGPFSCSGYLPDVTSYANCLIQNYPSTTYFVQVPTYGYQFTLTSTDDPSGLPTLSTTDRFAIIGETPYTTDFSDFTTGGQLTVTLLSNVGTAPSVPEPSGVLLLGTGLLGLMGMGLYKRRLA